MRVVIFSTLFFGLVFFMLQCGAIRDTGQPDPPFPAGAGEGPSDQAPAQKYAAELLSYLMQVVVGEAGDPGSRKAWKTRSLSVNLDFQEIGFIMQGPERKVSELMVYDANILGLSSVLYHYKRPLVIYPDNAEKVIQALCPDADFNFILLGKNVYLSIYFDAQRDIFPSANRVYLDITDIQRTQSDYDIDQIGEFLFNRLRAQMRDL